MPHEVTRRNGHTRTSWAGDPLFQPVVKARLSDEVRRQLLDRIADGRLPASTRLFEAELARQLGVSRTPLHEAMVSLGRDGLVECLGRRGWRVTPLCHEDAREIYPVIASLAALALNVTDSLVLGSLDELVRLSHLARSAPSPFDRLAAEREWHETLLAQCPNRLLVGTVRILLVRASRFERACVEEGLRRLSSELPSVTECLERADVRSASRILEKHWQERGRSVLDWIRQVPDPTTERDSPVAGAA